MLQAVLIDRFRLQGHPATQPFPGYALTAGPSPQLKPGSEGDSGCNATVPPEPLPHRSVSCRNITMAGFAKMLPDLAGNYFQLTAVADATGLTGSWSFTLRWTDRRFLATAGTDGIPIYDALSRQLGLRLETRDVPVPVFVVESVARTPTPNLSNVSRPAETGSPEFEVETIKISLSRDRPVVRRMPEGRLELRGFT
ncbi:MAG: hypothetical protein JWN34_736, partial [Bryobacterales bacterium]|nr:hypothetical protein [Bryobacterales bacterium]